MEDKNFFDDMLAAQNNSDATDNDDWEERDELAVQARSNKTLQDEEPVEGLLPFDVQQAVQKLIKSGKVERENQEKIYEVLRRDAGAVRTFLKNLAIALHIDEQEGIAFIGQMENDEGEPVGTLIHAQPLRLYETWVMLILREYYHEREAAGERRISIALEEIESRLVPFMPLSKSESADRSKVVGFLNRLINKYRVLSEDKANPGRYLISSVIRHLVSAQELAVLLEDYQKLAEEAVAEQEGRITSRHNTFTEQDAVEQQESLNLTQEQGAQNE